MHETTSKFTKLFLIIAMAASLFLMTAMAVRAEPVSVSPTSVTIGQSTTVTWSGFASNVNIKVYKGSTWWVDANTNQPGSGSQVLNTTGWEARSDYRVGIELRVSPNTITYSNYFTVNETVPPVFSSVSLPGSVNMPNKIYFSGTVSDNAALASVSMYVSGPKGNNIVAFTDTSVSNTTSKNLGSYYFDSSNSTYAGVTGPYTVYLRATDKSGNATNSSTFSATVNETVPPDPPTLTSPNNGVTLNDSTPDLAWDPPSGNASYFHVQIATNSSFTTIVNENSNVNAFVYTPPSLADGTYYWRAKTYYGVWGSWSSYRSFTISTFTPPTITVTSPSGGETMTKGQNYTITWASTGVIGNVKLHLYKGDIFLLPISNNQENSGSYYPFNPGSDLVDGTDYQIRIVDVNTGNISASSGYFSIEAAAVASPYPVWVPVYRLYKSADNDHFYTTNASERDNAVKNSGYAYEKIEFYMSDRSFPGGIPLYRYYYASTKKHYYTTNTGSAAAGYTEGPGVIGYVYPNPTEGMAPLYHLEGATGDHFYTISKFEHDNAVNSYGFADWGVACYVSPSAVANNRPQGVFAGVGMFNGAFSVPFTDISLSGAGPGLAFTRYYNSYNMYELPLGAGWSHSLYSYAIEHPNGSVNDVTIKWGNGTEEFFRNDGSNNFSGVLGTFSKLTKVNNDRYDLAAKDQTVYTFARVTVNSTMGASFIPDMPLISIQDKFSNKVVMSPNAAVGRIDRVYRMVNGAATSQSLTFNYDATNRLTSVVDTSVTPNRTVQYAYNADGYLSAVTDARGNTTTYGYNADGFLSTITYPEGNTVSVVYDVLGRAKSYTNGSIALTFDYNATDGTTVKNGANAMLANFQHDNQYRATTITKPSTTGTNIVVEPVFNTGNLLNLPQCVPDGKGNNTCYTYDANGNVLTITNQMNETTTYTYDGKNNITSIRDPRGNITTYTYDSTGKELRTIRTPMGVTTNYTYYPTGLINAVTDSSGHSTTYMYDANGNVTKINNNTLNTSTDLVNDGAGRRITRYDQARPSPQVTTWGYDNNDNVVSVQVGGHPAAIFQYDGNNRLWKVTDQRGEVTTHTYNTMNLLESLQSPDAKTWQYTYNGVGKLASTTLPDGTAITYEYYPNNKLQYVRHNGTEKLYYTYDNNGNTLSARAGGVNTTVFTYDDANRITAISDPLGNTVSYGYDLAGNRTSVVYSVNKTVHYTYDADNRLSTVKDWLGAGTTTYAYDNAGVLQSVTNANGTTTTFGYDGAHRLTSLANKRANNTVIADYGLTLDLAGNPASINKNEPILPAVPASADTTYVYGDANQIQSAGGRTYTHDSLGNVSGANDGHSLTYDYANRLNATTIGGISYSFQYDAFGNRISRTKGGVQTRYLQDLNGSMNEVLAEMDSGNAVQNYYIYGLGLISRITPAGVRSTYHFDPIGSTVAVTDDAGTIIESYAYDEFGAALAANPSNSTNPFRYVGKYGVMDEGNGLLHMRARYYDTDTGRFLSRDPIGFEGGDLNLYAYVEGNPLTGIDPNGLENNKDIVHVFEDKDQFGYEMRRIVTTHSNGDVSITWKYCHWQDKVKAIARLTIMYGLKAYRFMYENFTVIQVANELYGNTFLDPSTWDALRKGELPNPLPFGIKMKPDPKHIKIM